MLGSSVILLHKEPRLQWWGTKAWWRNWHNSVHSGILVLPKTSSSAVLLFDCIKSRARGTINSYHMGLNQGYIADRKPSAQTPWYPIPIFSEFKMIIFTAALIFLWLHEAKLPAFLFPHLPVNNPAEHSSSFNYSEQPHGYRQSLLSHVLPA